MLAGLLPTIQSFFLFFFSTVQRVNESDQKWGVTKYPFLECLREGIPRRLYQVSEVSLFGTLRAGVPRTGSKTPPVGDCSSSWLLWHDEKITSDVKTTNGPDPNVISIRDQHSTGLGSVITAYHYET